MNRLLLLAALLLLAVLPPAPLRAAAEPEEISPGEETMLMFVGEAQPMVTVASRQPESPAMAPAMVTVIGREEIEAHGYQSMAELLAMQPGFFIAARGRGSAPYLRGLPDAVLFLYDGVPITTDVTKSLAPMDREISLIGVERVEIVRGPGSILWGPDAFAGVVNIVPMRGRQRPGVEAGLAAGTGRQQGATVTWGATHQDWDTFFALAGGREQFHTPDSIARQDTGLLSGETVEPSVYTEVVGTANYGDWLQLTGRWSDFTRRYTMRNSDGSLVWPGEKEAPVNLLKATLSKISGPSHYSLTGFIQEIDYRILDADVERGQRNLVSELSLLWDRRLFSRGLLTAGASLRRNAVDGAVVRDGFLPDFLAPSTTLFVPRVEQADFTNELGSLFAQFRYQWGETAWWLGSRLDDHSQYRATHSYSLGFNRPVSDSLRLKGTYGTAFRSPYSSQLFDNLQFEPESIRTGSAQLAWTPAAGHELALTLFQSSLANHRTEDPYGGLSLPSERQVRGAELAGHVPLGRALEFSAGITGLGAADGDEHFRALRYSIIRPDGSQVSVFDTWDEPFDQGPRWLVNCSLNWRIEPGHTLLLAARTGGRVDYSYEKGTVEGSYRQPFLLDLSYRRPGFIPGHDSLLLSFANLLSQDSTLPDIFGPTAGPPLRATVVWQYRF
ncbi:MAG: TonB-dependent receptor [Pseudomonadota bacterium]